MKFNRQRVHKIICVLVITAIVQFHWTQTETQAGETQLLSAAIIQKEGKDFLEKTLQWDRDRMEVEVVYEGKPILTPRGNSNLYFSLPGQKKRIGRFPFMGFLKVDGILKKRINLYANVKITYDGFRASRSLPAGHVIQQQDVELFQMKTDQVLRNMVSDENDLIGHSMVVNLDQGEPILNYMVRKVPLVKSGDRILIIAQKGSLKVTAPGVVRENGFKNDTVRVENIQSRKMVYGTVVDSRTVRINF